MDMEDHNDNLDEFNVDNEGDLVFTKFTRASNETISNAALIYKSAQSDSIITTDITLERYFWMRSILR